AAIPARYALERGAWREAAQLQPTPGKYPFTEAMTHMARALGAARSGDPAAAQKDVEQIAVLRDELKAANGECGARQGEVTRLAGARARSLPRPLRSGHGRLAIGKHGQGEAVLRPAGRHGRARQFPGRERKRTRLPRPELKALQLRRHAETVKVPGKADVKAT